MNITVRELATLWEQKPDLVLLHVLPEEHFVRGHLPGAKNFCVYETAFLENVGAAIVHKERPIVVYGAGGASLDSQVAAEKLRQAGYTDVRDLRGGFDEWRTAGMPVEGDGSATVDTAPSGQFAVEVEKSVIRWTGRNLFNHHEGTLRLASGSLKINEGELTHAEFTLDMHSIACADLADSTWNAMLLRHLATDDFFATDAHPTAKFVAESAERITTCTEGMPNYVIHGQFTLRGVTKPLSFAVVIAAADSDNLTGQAQFELDRTEYGSVYGSGKFFAALGKHLVNDMVHLHLKIYAVRSAEAES